MAGLPKLEDWLAPWEVDGDGKPLDEPAEIDGDRLKKYLYGLLSDKEKAQERVADKEAELAQAKTDLADLQRQHESEEQTRERETKEREKRYEAAEKRERERQKVDVIVEAFEEQGITPKQAKSLAKRVQGDDEKAWLEDANDLVENGFRIGAKKVEAEVEESTDDDDLSFKPKVIRRGTGERDLSTQGKGKAKSVSEELDAAGIGGSSW